VESESSILNLAFRQALLGIIAREGSTLSARTSLVLTRIATGLRFIELQASAWPTAARQVRDAQLTLLRDSIEELDRQQLCVSPDVRSCAESDAASRSFNELVSAQATCIAMLGRADLRSSEAAQRRDFLLSRAFALEQSVRDAVREWAMERLDEPASTEEAVDGNVPHAERLQALLHAAGIPEESKICSISHLFSHSSKQAFLVLTNGAEGWPERAVLRREPAYNIVDTSLPDEFDVLAVAHRAGLPVPRPLCAGWDSSALGGRFILMAFVPGETQNGQSLGRATETVLRQSAEFLAGLHRIDPNIVARMRKLTHLPWHTRLLERLESIYGIWLRDKVEQSAMIEAAFAWLRNNVRGVSDAPCIVHGDFNLRNIMIDRGRISAVVDWETSRLGHRAEDLAYFKREISNLMPWSDYLTAYQNAGAPPIAARDISYFDVMTWLWRVVVTVTAYSGYYRGMHRDFTFLTTRFVEYEDSLDGLSEAMRNLSDGN
jgi:aminoglycoside phosphotransferase (APT) family kinase protein